MTTFKARTLSVTINRDWREVYQFAADPANMAQWAAGLGEDFSRDGEFWVAHQEGNPIRIHFTPSNPFGVINHDVHVGSDVVHVASRVVPNDSGAEVTFLLLQERGMTNAEFERDAAMVQKDLDALKAILEG